MASTIVPYYVFNTSAGTVKIVPHNGRFEIVYNNEGLGSYHSPAAAADDASGGHTFSPSNGVDLGDLGIPADIGEWERRVFATVNRLRPP